jgi:hypothetical protein
MGWGNIGLSWTRYAKSAPTRNCQRCHLDHAEAEDSCPHCGSIEDHELQYFLRGLEAKRKKSTSLLITFFAALLLYAIFVLFVLPGFMA